jgi:hypothetical protein
LTRRFWTDEEQALLQAHYPTGGTRATKVALMNAGYLRSIVSIREIARRLGVRIPGRAQWKKQNTRPELDEAIRHEYRNGRPNLKRLAERIGRPHGWVKVRAQEMGLTRVKEPPWAAEEEALVMELVESGKAVTTIHKALRRNGYQRSLGAIRSRVERLGLQWQREHWTALDVAKLLSVDGKTVTRWIELGWLKAKKGRGPSTADREIQDQTKQIWVIQPRSVRTFMLTHSGEWDHRRVRKEILLDILCGEGK